MPLTDQDFEGIRTQIVQAINEPTPLNTRKRWLYGFLFGLTPPIAVAAVASFNQVALVANQGFRAQDLNLPIADQVFFLLLLIACLSCGLIGAIVSSVFGKTLEKCFYISVGAPWVVLTAIGFSSKPNPVEENGAPPPTPTPITEFEPSSFQ